MNNSVSDGKKLFYNKEYKKALEIFKENNEYYFTGLCYLLLKDTKNASLYWNINKKSCPASQFGLNVIDFINIKSRNIPSFFQTRAFLEVYINLFIENNLISYCENLISCSDTLFKANPESYKFIARALFANGYFDLAITFCKKSLDIFYSDPEALLIISQCYYLINKKEVAKLYLDKLRKIEKNYYPAVLFDEILSKEVK